METTSEEILEEAINRVLVPLAFEYHLIDQFSLEEILRKTARRIGPPGSFDVVFSPDIRDFLSFLSLDDAMDLFERKDLDRIAKYEEILDEFTRELSPNNLLEFPALLLKASYFISRNRKELLETGTTKASFLDDVYLNYVTQLLPTRFRGSLLVPDETREQEILKLRPRWQESKIRLLDLAAQALKNVDTRFTWDLVWKTFKEILTDEDLVLLDWIDKTGLRAEEGTTTGKNIFQIPAGGLEALCLLFIEIIIEIHVGPLRLSEATIRDEGLIESGLVSVRHSLLYEFHRAIQEDCEEIWYTWLDSYFELKQAAIEKQIELHSRFRGDIEKLTAPKGRVQPPQHAGSFKLLGNMWLIEFNGKSFHLKDLTGIRYIAMLLEYPGKDFNSFEIQGITPPSQSDLSDNRDTGTGEEQDIDDAFTTAGKRSSKLPQEFESRVLDRNDNMRTLVQKNYKYALKKIENFHPSLAQHLGNFISTGYLCSYNPSVPSQWEIQREFKPEATTPPPPPVIVRRKATKTNT